MFFFISKSRCPLGTVDHLRSHVLIKIRLMAYHDDASLIFLERSLEFVLSIDIQVIGRLVEYKQIGFAVDELAKPYLSLLST